MKKKKNEIIVRDEQNITEEGAVAKKANARFSSEQNFEQGVQIGIEEALVESAALKEEQTTPHVQHQDQQLDDAEKTVEKQKTKKSKWTSLILMLVNIAVVAVILLTQIKSDNMVPFSEIVQDGINWWFFAICIISFVAVSLLECGRVGVFIRSTTKKNMFSLSYKSALIGKYYDCITPLSTGGQPFQIYYLKKHGLTGAQSVSVPLGRYVFHQITSVLIFTVVIFSTLSMGLGGSVGTTVVSAASWVGYVIHCGLIFLVLFISINRKVGTRFVGWFVKIGHKLKLVKNYDKTYTNLLKGVDDFQSTIKYYVKSPKTFISALLVTAANLILHYSIPVLIYCTFAGYHAGLWWEIFTKCVMIDLASSFIPLPGGSGVAELSFTTLFASMFVGGRLFWALLFWRILTYYGYIFQGLIIIVYDYFVGNKKYEWQKRKNELELESEKFKAEQLSEFKKKKTRKQKV